MQRHKITLNFTIPDNTTKINENETPGARLKSRTQGRKESQKSLATQKQDVQSRTYTEMSNNLNQIDTPKELPNFEERKTSIGSELLLGGTEGKQRFDTVGDATKNILKEKQLDLTMQELSVEQRSQVSDAMSPNVIVEARFLGKTPINIQEIMPFSPERGAISDESKQAS